MLEHWLAKPVPEHWFLETAALCFAGLMVSFVFTSVYFHRAMAHNSVKLNGAIAFWMRFTLWWLAAQAMRAWAAVHRKHHAYSDIPGDPHSPHLVGTWKLFRKHEHYYLKAANDPELLAQFGRGLPVSRFDRVLENNTLGMIVGALIFTIGFGVWMGPWGLLIGVVAYFAQFFLYLKGSALINTIGHMYGYQNFTEDKDGKPIKATNFPGLDLLVGGEGNHNNHHYDKTSPRLSVKWWEVDPGWWLIQPLRLFGLAKLNCRTLKEKLKLKAKQNPV